MSINDEFMRLDDPATLVLDAMIEKLQKREKPFGGYYLHPWLEQHYKPLLVRAWTENDPLDDPPLPSECPCVLIVGDENNPWTPHGAGAATWEINYTLLMFLYDSDHRMANRFRWLVTTAIGTPWMNTLDPIYASSSLCSKWGPSQGMGSGPVPIENRRGNHLWSAKLPLEFTFQGTNLPFFQPGM